MRDRRIFALYKGDTYLMDGTIREIAKKRGVKESSIRFLTTPAYHKRISNKIATQKKPTKGYLEIVCLDGDDDA